MPPSFRDLFVVGARSRLTQLEQTRLQIERHLQAYQTQLTNATKARILAEKELREMPEDEQQKRNVEAQWKNLQRHAGIESVKVRGSRVIITTKLLFTDIREEAGSRVLHRTCLGAYRITWDMEPNSANVAVQNLVADNGGGMYAHWGVAGQGRSPCWGDYASEMILAVRGQDVYRFAEMMVGYFKSTEDGGAYTRSHQWRQRRIPVLGRRTSDQNGGTIFRVGETVAYVHPDRYEGVELAGRVGVLLNNGRRGDYVHVKFRAQIVGQEQYASHRDCPQRGHCWNVPTENLVHISQPLFEAGEVWDGWTTAQTEASREQAFFQKLDALPDGSTLSDAERLHSELYAD